MRKRSWTLLGAIIALGSILTACASLGGPKIGASLTMQTLVGRWAEWSSNLGPTGIIYEFHADQTMKISASGLQEDLLIGTYEIQNGKLLRLEWTEPVLGLSFGEAIWEVISSSARELVFDRPYEGRIKLRRI